MTKQKPGILVAVDPVEVDDKVLLQHAKDLARQFDTSVELFSCTYNSHLFGERLYETRSARKTKAHHVSVEKKRLDAMAESLSADGVTVKTDVYWDLPEHEAIIRKAIRSKAMMVLRRSQYRSAVDRALMSNDDWSLIRHCPTPLYLVRGNGREKSSGVIWACVDPMHEHDKPAALDDEIIRQAQRLAEARDAHVELVHTFDSTPAIAAVAAGVAVAETVPSKEIHEQTRKAHYEKLSELAVRHNIPFELVHNYPGPPRITLPAMAIEKKPDVIVMGAIARGFLKRLFIGNTAEKVLDKLPGDLCIVKPGDFVSAVAIESPYEMSYRETISKEKGVA